MKLSINHVIHISALLLFCMAVPSHADLLPIASATTGLTKGATTNVDGYGTVSTPAPTLVVGSFVNAGYIKEWSGGGYVTTGEATLGSFPISYNGDPSKIGALCYGVLGGAHEFVSNDDVHPWLAAWMIDNLNIGKRPLTGTAATCYTGTDAAKINKLTLLAGKKGLPSGQFHVQFDLTMYTK
ncbi:hypothetical protein DPU24_27600 [Salmonella enterica subsp. enterica serovar Oranienburg]|nr:hypothetical protein [Salmonella enterica subsp. enterica serovar Newport]EBW6364459.1 hypothetical protein [Salmonella enterica subsp. enterica serovar Oranienburg]